MPSRQPDAPDVFIVDDEPEVGCALGRLLRSAGYAVASFTSAEAFLGAHPAPCAGVLVADVRMPGMSGPELQAELTARGAKIPVLFISAVDDARIRAAVLAAGGAGWLGKPVDGDRLLESIESLFAGPG
jgi:FixJ family two-component response regulator